MSTYKIIIDMDTINLYNKYYFDLHPKAKKAPISKPYHPSINTWCILPRLQMNSLKQKWKEFGCWWIKEIGYSNMLLDVFDMEFLIFFDTKRRHDVDNQVPKFILDSFTASKFIIDDDENHLRSLTIKTGYDKNNPRTEIKIITR